MRAGPPFVIERYRPINIHLNNNEIIIIFSGTKTRLGGFELSSLFFHRKKSKIHRSLGTIPAHCELWRFINIILIYIQAIIVVEDCLFRGNVQEEGKTRSRFQDGTSRCDQLFVYGNKLFNVNEPLLKKSLLCAHRGFMFLIFRKISHTFLITQNREF